MYNEIVQTHIQREREREREERERTSEREITMYGCFEWK